MRRICIIFFTLFLTLMSTETRAHRITDDRGGRIGTYLDMYDDQKFWHEQVAIDGLCASACTLVFRNVSTGQVCATKRAKLGFHAAWDPGPRGTMVTNPEATRMLLNFYPDKVRRWIASRGGLTRKMIWLKGRQLRAFIPPCPPQPRREQNFFAAWSHAQLW